MAVTPPEVVNCTSEDTIESTVAIPAPTQAANDKRVLTGKVSAILIMAISLVEVAPSLQNVGEGALFR